MSETLPVYKCGNCGANMNRSSLTCEYCDTNYEPLKPEVKAKAEEYMTKRVLFWTKRVKINKPCPKST